MAKTQERFGVLVDNLKKIGLRYKTMINELRSGRLSSVPTSVGVPLKQVRAHVARLPSPPPPPVGTGACV